MSRWKWPDVAAREAQRQRRERHKTILQLGGIVLLIAAVFAVYLLLIGIPTLQRRQEHRHPQRHRDGTNKPPRPTNETRSGVAGMPANGFHHRHES